MAIRSTSYLKQKFKAGSKPTAQDFEDLVDSFEKQDIPAIIESVVSNESFEQKVMEVTETPFTNDFFDI